MSKVYAVEGGCFALSHCAVISPAMVDELCDTPDKQLPDATEGLLMAELDLGLISVATNAMDPVGHYSRPDVCRLLLNKEPGKRVEHMALPLDGNECEISLSDAP